MVLLLSSSSFSHVLPHFPQSVNNFYYYDYILYSSSSKVVLAWLSLGSHFHFAFLLVRSALWPGNSLSFADDVDGDNDNLTFSCSKLKTESRREMYIHSWIGVPSLSRCK